MFTDIYKTDKKYSVIYADPPWFFKTYSVKGKMFGAERHYPTMQKEEIQNVPVKKLSDKNCVLFLWVTAPCLIEGIELITAWGFKYKTVAFTWVKQNKKSDGLFTGMGYYTRANAEYCLLATKGKILERKSHGVHSVVLSHIERHSIWTRFTPSYELSGVYFEAGKADISKREARLFEKQEFVFDILGGDLNKEREKIEDEIERRDNELSETDKPPVADINELDKLWNEKVKEVHTKILKVCEALMEEEGAALLKAKLEDKLTLIRLYMDGYDQSVRQRLQRLASYLEDELPKLLALQEQAKNK